MGIHPMDVPLDLDGVKASFGVDTSTETLTYRDLQKRRELIGKRLRDRPSS
jgi:ubiquinone biosynthesis protein